MATGSLKVYSYLDVRYSAAWSDSDEKTYEGNSLKMDLLIR